ncbi:MAG: hypothetical protein OEZ10_11565 [Gammaproteobacteria bacterium]|nr:hypothetical protein [Gammaproteobacteria bacterium]
MNNDLLSEAEYILESIQDGSSLPVDLEAAQSRYDAYRLEDGKLCPRCFMIKGLPTEMKNEPSGNHLDRYSCPACSFVIEIEA